MMTPITEALKLLEAYIGTVNAIRIDYKLNPDACMELSAAEDNLKEALEQIQTEQAEEEEEELDFEQLLEKMKALGAGEVDEIEILELVTDHECLQTRAQELGMVAAKVDSMTEREKLIDFINTNVYPYCVNHRAALEF